MVRVTNIQMVLPKISAHFKREWDISKILWKQTLFLPYTG